MFVPLFFERLPFPHLQLIQSLCENYKESKYLRVTNFFNQRVKQNLFGYFKQ